MPKDGPSAGIAMATAMLSALTGRKIKAGYAMTGEITLRGRVLPIGGLKEKSMAAYREGIKTVLIPKDNLSDLFEVDEEVKKAVEFLPMSDLSQVLKNALVWSKAAEKKSRAKKAETPIAGERSSSLENVVQQ